MALAMGGVMGGVIKHMLIGISGFVRLFTHFIWSPGRESVSDVPRGRLCAGLHVVRIYIEEFSAPHVSFSISSSLAAAMATARL